MQAGGPLLDDDTLWCEILSRLLESGHAEEDIAWAENTKPPRNADEFATETIFVICNSGMKHTIARQIFDKCMGALRSGQSASTVFGHPGKAAAMDKIWAEQEQLFAGYMEAEDKLEFCRSIPWIGGITCFHLAKNFGAQVAKPDVHLQRLADRHATSPQELCEAIAQRSSYCINTIDLLLWRACATGILDGRTATLVQPKQRPEPQPYQEELFEPVQTDLFA
jgi:hypothetical protein